MRKTWLFLGIIATISATTLGVALAALAGVLRADEPGPKGPRIAAPLGSAFTYQGQLIQSGSPVNGTCDFQFRLYDAPSGGNQTGPQVDINALPVNNGLFTALLDFGTAPFTGEARWLEVGVRCPAGSGSFTVLSPRQGLTPVPYALWAASGPGGGGNFWSLTGNASTSPGVNFLGTTDNVPLEVRVNNARALRVEPGSTPNLIGGWSGNNAAAGVVGATIGGGGAPTGCGSGGSAPCPNRVTANYGTVGGGYDNTASGGYATVSGGRDNDATNGGATVGGGQGHRAEGEWSTVGGGLTNAARGYSATVGGGQNNNASGGRATVAGGQGNIASGAYTAISGGLSNNASGDWATVGGGFSNTVTGFNATIGGGQGNSASGFAATIGGGRGNSATADYATIAGGGLSDPTNLFTGNRVTDNYGTVGGGGNNQAGNADFDPTNAQYATVGGGSNNTASGYASTVPGGLSNQARGDYSFAAGRRAHAHHNGSFVLKDSVDAEVMSWGDNQLTLAFSGGIRALSSATSTVGTYLPPGGNSWSAISDRAVKDNLTPVDGQAVLERLLGIPIYRYTLKSQDPSIQHMGPVAQDFAAAFGLGEDERYIGGADADGVVMAALQGLAQQVKEQQALIVALQQQNASLEARLALVEAYLAALLTAQQR